MSNGIFARFGTFHRIAPGAARIPPVRLVSLNANNRAGHPDADKDERRHAPIPTARRSGFQTCQHGIGTLITAIYNVICG